MMKLLHRAPQLQAMLGSRLSAAPASKPGPALIENLVHQGQRNLVMSNQRFWAYHLFAQCAWQAVYINTYLQLVARHACLAHEIPVAVANGYARGVNVTAVACRPVGNRVSSVYPFAGYLQMVLKQAGYVLPAKEADRLITDLLVGAVKRVEALNYSTAQAGLALLTAQLDSCANNTLRYSAQDMLYAGIRNTCCRYYLVQHDYCTGCPHQSRSRLMCHSHTKTDRTHDQLTK